MRRGFEQERSILAAGALALLTACPQTVVTLCGPRSCAGCCDSSGVCLLGDQDVSCGGAGVACAQCLAGTTCQRQACLAGSQGAAGGSAGGSEAGGSSTAGGSSADAGGSSGGAAGSSSGGGQAGGSAGAGTGGGSVVRALSGVRWRTWVGDTSTVAVPTDLSGAPLQTLHELDGGTFLPLSVAGTVDGGFAAFGLPPGPYYFKYSSAWYVLTNEDQLDLSFAIMGRPNHATPTAPTLIDVVASGLMPWSTSNYLSLAGTNVGLMEDDVRSLGASYPVAGATSATFTVDTAMADEPVLLEAGRGDTLVLTQLLFASTPIRHIAAVKSATITGLTQVSGQRATVNAAFAPLTPSTFALDWRVSQFEALRAAVHPAANLGAHHFFLRGVASQTPARGVWGSSQTLLYATFAAGSAEALASLQYGNPFGPSMMLQGQYMSSFTTLVQAPGATATPFSTWVTVSGPLNLLTGPIAPRVGPPRDVTVNGVAVGAGPVTGAGTSPVIAWSAPALGSPDSYQLRVYRLGNAAGQTEIISVATLVLEGTRARLPPNILQPGNTYAVTLTAMLTGIDVEKTPLEAPRQVSASADAVLTSLTP